MKLKCVKCSGVFLEYDVKNEGSYKCPGCGASPKPNLSTSDGSMATGGVISQHLLNHEGLRLCLGNP